MYIRVFLESPIAFPERDFLRGLILANENSIETKPALRWTVFQYVKIITSLFFRNKIVSKLRTSWRFMRTLVHKDRVSCDKNRSAFCFYPSSTWVGTRGCPWICKSSSSLFMSRVGSQLPTTRWSAFEFSVFFPSFCVFTYFSNTHHVSPHSSITTSLTHSTSCLDHVHNNTTESLNKLPWVPRPAFFGASLSTFSREILAHTRVLSHFPTLPH